MTQRNCIPDELLELAKEHGFEYNIFDMTLSVVPEPYFEEVPSEPLDPEIVKETMRSMVDEAESLELDPEVPKSSPGFISTPPSIPELKKLKRGYVWKGHMVVSVAIVHDLRWRISFDSGLVIDYTDTNTWIIEQAFSTITCVRYHSDCSGVPDYDELIGMTRGQQFDELAGRVVAFRTPPVPPYEYQDFIFSSGLILRADHRKKTVEILNQPLDA